MSQLRNAVIALGTRISPALLVLGLLALNASWLVILAAYDAQFRQVAGYPLLDLQNDLGPGRWVTPDEVLRQITGYSQEAKTLYWPFFILDNFMPQLAFGAFALLWAYLLSGKPAPLAARLLHSPLVLIPLGVGFFDWLENLSYVAAIHGGSSPSVLAAVYAGLTFKWVKAGFLFLTFTLTVPLTAYHLHQRLRAGRRTRHPVN